VVVISDMSGWNAETIKRIKRLARHNDIMASLVFDPLEKSLPDSSQLVLSDGDMQIQVDVDKGELKGQFKDQFVSAVEFMQAELNKHGVPVMPMNTHDPVQDQIRHAIGAGRGVARR
jgi:hypothetical protein